MSQGSRVMSQGATLVIDIETVGQDTEHIPSRAREILLDVETDEDRQRVLANLGSDLGQIRPHRFVTFNGKSFDFPYINIRSAIMDVPIPRDIQLDTRRFNTERHFDVREVLTNHDRYRKGTLEFFCDIFGVASPKNGIDGSKVGDFFKAGRLDDIAHYCIADCKAT